MIFIPIYGTFESFRANDIETMEPFQFILRFDDADHQLTAQNGLSIEEVSVILSSLSKAIGVGEEEKVVLSDVRGNCYALELTTPSVTKFETLKVIHKKIAENDFDGLSNAQKTYASTIKGIIESKGYNFKAYNPSKDFIVSIDEVIIPYLPSQFFNTGSIYGIITGIGGKTIDSTPCIDVSDANYKIKLTSAQEDALIKYYKKQRLRFLIRKRIKIEGDTEKVIDAKLISYEVSSSKSFEDIASEISSKKNVFNNVKDSEKAVRKLRD